MAACLGLALQLVGSASARADDVVVLSEAPLAPAIVAVGQAWRMRGGEPVRAFHAASSDLLVGQIAHHVRGDVFLSVGPGPMDAAQAKDLIAPGTRFDLLGQQLALLGQAGSAPPVELEPKTDLVALLGPGRLAIAELPTVLTGAAASSALQGLGLWQTVADRVVSAASTADVLFLLERGEAQLGAAFASDAAAAPSLAVRATFPMDSYPPVVCPVALTRDGDNPETRRFLAFLKTSDAKRLLEQRGYTVLD